jgi:transposase
LPVEKPKNTMDLPIAISFRKVLDDIVYVLRSSCQWKRLPSEFSSGSAYHRRFQQWVKMDIFKKIWTRLLKEYDHKRGIKWK